MVSTSKPLKVLLFAGPTLARATAIDPQLALDGVIVLPPIKRGDVPRIVQQSSAPGVLAIVDGYFHLENLSVGHMEIRLALRREWQVWGLSSMGAIRAAEMHHMGMQGYGKVFARFRDDGDFRDDEVALLHEPNPPYREATEPLVHLRAALDELVTDGVITDDHRREITDDLMGRWFGERSLQVFRDLLAAKCPDKLDEVREKTRAFDRFRIKAHDLLGFLAERPWTRPQPQEKAP